MNNQCQVTAVVDNLLITKVVYFCVDDERGKFYWKEIDIRKGFTLSNRKQHSFEWCDGGLFALA